MNIDKILLTTYAIDWRISLENLVRVFLLDLYNAFDKVDNKILINIHAIDWRRSSTSCIIGPGIILYSLCVYLDTNVE